MADWLEERSRHGGVGVVLEAEHICIFVCGVHVSGSQTRTSASAGELADDGLLRR